VLAGLGLAGGRQIGQQRQRLARLHRHRFVAALQTGRAE
jgi:hypothetical protein